MALYLVQHGKCLSKDVDPEKGLSQEGMAEVQRIAEVANGYDIKPTVICHSGKKRARQTAEILSEALGPPESLREIDGIKPLDEVAPFATGLEAGQNIMLVGHLPFMERLCSFLTTGNIEPPVFKFQNGGIVCLEQFPENDNWAIRWALMPNIS